MTNEQAVAAAEDRLSKLKRVYMSYLQPIAQKISSSQYTPSVEELLRCQQLGTEFFNYLESVVGQSGLLGAHQNGMWVTGFAETCHSVLTAYVVHINFLRSHSEVLQNAIAEPDPHAFANMQRMVTMYLEKDKSKNLKKKFKDNALPVTGFVKPAHEDQMKVPIWQLVTSISIGIIYVASVVVLAVFIPNPTQWQAFVFRGCLALGLAAMAVIVPGFLSVNARIRGWGNYLKIVAGGAIAIFIIIWLITPPSVGDPGEDRKTGDGTNEQVHGTAHRRP